MMPLAKENEPPSGTPIVGELARKNRFYSMGRGEIARALALFETKYQLSDYIPPHFKDETGLNFPTALAAMHAINAKGQNEGWEYEDLLLALPATQAALTTAGFAHAREGLEALLTGATGNLRDVMSQVLPPEAAKKIQFVTGAAVVTNDLMNVFRTIGLLYAEKEIESRLLKLTKLQQDMLLDPRRTQALLGVLNGQYTSDQPLLQTGLPHDAQKHLVAISPFSLEDMKAMTHLFNAIEWSRDSIIQRQSRRLLFETELARLDAAGVNLTKMATVSLTSVTKNTVHIIIGGVGGIAAGVYLGGNEVWQQIQDASARIQEINRQRGATRGSASSAS